MGLLHIPPILRSSQVLLGLRYSLLALSEPSAGDVGLQVGKPRPRFIYSQLQYRSLPIIPEIIQSEIESLGRSMKPTYIYLMFHWSVQLIVIHQPLQPSSCLSSSISIFAVVRDSSYRIQHGYYIHCY